MHPPFLDISMVESGTVNSEVVGSSPTPGASEGVAKWLRQRTLTPLCDGSTPSTLAKYNLL